MNYVTALIALIGAAAAALAAYALFVAPCNIKVRDLELSFPNLPLEFDGYSILHLSDFHLKKLGRLERRTMEIIGAREIDVCLITGDVTAHPRASDIFRRVCSAIRRRDGMYMVLGNSEHKPWLDTHTLLDALSFEGMTILLNQSATIRRGEGRIVVAGVDDPFSRLDDINAAFERVDPQDFVVFLTHCPSITPRAIEHGADLILAGHTHGGQIRLPWLKAFWTHMRSNKALNDGLYLPADLRRILRIDPNDSVLFVHRGIGTSRVYARLLCPPEVVYITLRRQA